jgi:hypothetical protein
MSKNRFINFRKYVLKPEQTKMAYLEVDDDDDDDDEPNVTPFW